MANLLRNKSAKEWAMRKKYIVELTAEERSHLDTRVKTGKAAASMRKCY